MYKVFRPTAKERRPPHSLDSDHFSEIIWTHQRKAYCHVLPFLALVKQKSIGYPFRIQMWQTPTQPGTK